MNGYRQISARQWFFISLFSTICLTPFGFPTTLYHHLGHGAWVPIAAAYLLTIWGVFVSIRLCERFGKKNLAEWAQDVLGRWLGSLYAIGAILVTYTWGVGMVYVFTDLVTYTQLPNTSRILLLLFIFGPVLYLLLGGLEAWVRFAEFFGVMLLFGLILINVPQLGNATFTNLLPITTAFREPAALARPEIVAALFVFRGIFSIYFLYPHIKPERLFRWSLFSATLAFGEVLAAVVLPIAVFGASFAKTIAYPYQESLGTVALPWLPFERITLLTPAVWQLIMVYVLCVSMYAAAIGMRTLLRLKGERKERRLILVLGLVSFGLTLIPLQKEMVMKLMVYWSLAGIAVLIVIPTLLWMILAVNGRFFG